MPVPAPSTSVNSQAQMANAEKPKRRTWLPQPGQPKCHSCAPSELPDQHTDSNEPLAGNIEASDSSKIATAASESNAQNAIPGRLRPRPVCQTGATPSERADNGDKPTTSRSMRPPSSTNRTSEPRTAGLNRTQSLRKSGAPVKSAQPAGTSHSRAQSTSTVSVARKATVKPKTYAERPKSLLTAPNLSSKTNATSTGTAPAVTRASARLAGLNRSASARTASERPISAASIGTTKPENSSASQPKRREPLNEESGKTARPAFSTLQQHFTPRKTGKAPTSTFLHPAPITGPQTLPPEVISLQSELLQLHLLHASSAEVVANWELSAKKHLHTKFDEVASTYHAMQDYERAAQEQKNLEALVHWSTGSSLAKYVQSLSGPLHELPSLVEPGGRIQRLVAAFEHWIGWVEDVRRARKSSTFTTSSSAQALTSLTGLDNTWMAENAALTRKLNAFERDLEGLGGLAPGSSGACVVGACTALVVGLLEELRVMRGIEEDVVREEKEWVEGRLRGIARSVDFGDGEGDVAAWRA